MILLVDNYDSFTYNLYQYFRMLDEDTLVVRNDEVDTGRINELRPEMIALSPGPGKPEDAGSCIQIIHDFADCIPIFGICLGMQAIAQAFGARVDRAKEPVHGKVRPIRHENCGLFRKLPNPLAVTRYHSLIVEKSSLPKCLKVTAWSEEDEIMALEHTKLRVCGVQFHPEAWLTEYGLEIVRNAVEQAKEATC